jgi:apolipoprotein D and lipocalin family protein
MAASLDDLGKQIEAAERTVHAADARAAEATRSLKAHWRARGPTLIIGAASALLAFQLVRGRRRARRAAFERPAGWSGAIEQLLRLGGPRLMTIISALIAGLVTKKTRKPLATAPSVDLQRYAGTWYEIARLPEKHEKDCASDATATYEPTIDGGLRIVNRCRRRDGSIKRAIGRAEVQDVDSNAKLRVTFAAQLLDPLPFVWSDYCIIDVANDYSTAIVGTPDRSHLWLLARQPTVSENVRSAFIAKALGQGFDTSQLVYGRHTGNEAGTEAGIDAGTGAASASAASSDTTRSAMESVAATAEAGPAAEQTVPRTDYDRVAATQDANQH